MSMELNKKNIGSALDLKEDLEYLISHLKSGELTEYVKLEEMEKVKEEVENDIAEYHKKQATSCPVKVGAIIRISGGDGVSYSQRDYYKITGFTDRDEICFDQITVVKGDYGNEIKVDKKSKDQRKNWIKRYNRNYHKDDISEEEWDVLIGYAEKIPWL